MPHRFEAAPSGRAGCTNKECKDNKVKILKGELRVGSWIENERFQSYTWRHWGCTTPKVLDNIKKEWLELQEDDDGKNYEFLDGWDELPEEYRVKVRTALEQGHVDDADWKGDAEMNVPGSIGFRVRGKKKKADEAKDKNEDTEKEASSPEKPKAKKPRAKKAHENGDAKEPKPAEENGDAEEPAEKPTKKRGPRAKAAADADDAAPAADTETKPKKRGRPAKSDSTEEKAAPAKAAAKRKANDDEDKENTEDKPKRRGRPAKSQKTQADDGEAASEKPKAKRGRKKAEANSDNN